MDSSKRDKDVFLTFKGASPIALEQLQLDADDFIDVEGSGVESKIHILQDTPLNRSSDRSVDFRASFDSSRNGGGLLELGKYGVRPLVDQDLSLVKAMIQSFLNDTPGGSDLLANQDSLPMSNIIVRRTSVASCQYLFCVVDTMEAGQTVPVFFPSLDEVFGSKRFENNQFSSQQLLVDALQVLSRGDVRKLIVHLSNQVQNIGLDSLVDKCSAVKEEEISDELKTQLLSSVRLLCRTHWLSCHLFHLAPCRTVGEMKQRDSLRFGSNHPLNGEEIPPKVQNMIRAMKKEEIRRSILSLLDLDSVCGSARREGWCDLALEHFERHVLSVAQVESNEAPGVKKALLDEYEAINSLNLREDDDLNRWSFKVSPLASDQHSANDNVVFCTAEGGNAVEVKLIEMKDKRDRVATDWYKQFLLQIEFKILNACQVLFDETDFPHEELIGAIKALAKSEELIGIDYKFPLQGKFPYRVSSLPVKQYQPQSYQFFLGIVWPTLSEFGWKVEIAKYPSDVKFIVPQWKGEHQRHGKLAKLAKQQRDRRRHDLARAVNQLGLGTLPKLTKRLFLASKPLPGTTSSEQPSKGKKTKSKKFLYVSDIVNMFLEESFGGDKKPFYTTAKETIEFVLDCFDKLAHSLYHETSGIKIDDAKSPRQSCSVDVFMQFLLVLPNLLTQSKLELQEINDVLQIAHDLIAFCTDKCNNIFPQQILPPLEEYAVNDRQFSSNLVNRLHQSSRVIASTSGRTDELVEVIWEEDKKVLSDFVVTVMEQVVACRATDEDTKRKHRKIHVGYPGAVCRHCMGRNGEGRYFFTTIESLTTLGTVFEKHFAKCPHVPSNIKKAISTSKMSHHEQRKHLPSGTQQAYFLKLWDRLRTMRISGIDGGMSETIPLSHPAYTPDAKNEAKQDSSKEREGQMEFGSPLEVLDYIRNTVPWKGTKDIEDALNQYYTCIDFGGRIYNTKGMPKHFSPAWLLAKVGPKRAKKKRKNLPG